MPLEKNMNQKKITKYLTAELKSAIIQDIRPCLNLGHDEGGYFSVPRLVLSCVDYLGALYNGYNGRRDPWGKRIFTDGRYAKAVLYDLFGQVDANYRIHNDLLWEIYRNGTIHLHGPKLLKSKSSNRTIGWIAHKLGRSAKLGSPHNLQAQHLVPHHHGNNRWSQPISIVCLFDDLSAVIDNYASLIHQDPNLESKFRQTANALVIPEETSLKWW